MSGLVTLTTESVLSNYLANAMLQQFLVRNGGWLACHLADPTDLGLAGTEVAGLDYVRQRILFTPAGAKTIGSNNPQTFAGLPASTVRYLAVWDRVANGNYLFKVRLSDPGITVAQNGLFLAAPGDVALVL